MVLSSLQSSSAILNLEVDVTVRRKEPLRDGRMPFTGRDVERRSPILVLKIDVTASSNELFRDGLIPMSCHDV